MEQKNSRLFGYAESRAWLEQMTRELFDLPAAEFVRAANQGAYLNRPIADVLMTVVRFVGESVFPSYK